MCGGGVQGDNIHLGADPPSNISLSVEWYGWVCGEGVQGDHLLQGADRPAENSGDRRGDVKEITEIVFCILVRSVNTS